VDGGAAVRGDRSKLRRSPNAHRSDAAVETASLRAMTDGPPHAIAGRSAVTDARGAAAADVGHVPLTTFDQAPPA
jgi:hypothetical protein